MSPDDQEMPRSSDLSLKNKIEILEQKIHKFEENSKKRTIWITKMEDISKVNKEN